MDNNKEFNIQTENATTPVEPTAPEAKKKDKKPLIIAVAAVVAVALIVIISVVVSNSPASIYKKAAKSFEAANYIEAIEKYEKILDYEDAQDKCNDAYVELAKKYMAEEKFEEASEIFAEHKDVENADLYSNYVKAIQMMNNAEYEDAIKAFVKLEDFEDAKKYLNESYYKFAEEYYTNKSYSEAKTYYNKTEGFEDVVAKVENCDLMLAEEYYKDGDLVKAQELFSKLPADLSFNNVSVSARLDTLKKNAKIVNMCGTWKGTGGKMTVRQTHDSTGLWDQWDGTFTNNMTMKIIINDDGTYTFKGVAKYYVYTNYSSLSHLLKNSERSVKFEHTGKTLPAELYSNSTTKLTYDGSKVKLNYNWVNENYSVNFTYKYTSSITYSK